MREEVLLKCLPDSLSLPWLNTNMDALYRFSCGHIYYLSECREMTGFITLLVRKNALTTWNMYNMYMKTQSSNDHSKKYTPGRTFIVTA